MNRDVDQVKQRVVRHAGFTRSQADRDPLVQMEESLLNVIESQQ